MLIFFELKASVSWSLLLSSPFLSKAPWTSLHSRPLLRQICAKQQVLWEFANIHLASFLSFDEYWQVLPNFGLIYKTQSDKWKLHNGKTPSVDKKNFREAGKQTFSKNVSENLRWVWISKCRLFHASLVSCGLKFLRKGTCLQDRKGT